MVNLTALQNLPTISFNTTNITNSKQIVTNLVNSTDSVSQGYFGLGVMLAVFIVLFYTTFRQDGDIRIDLMRSMMISSGFTSMLGLIMLVTGLSSSFVHLIWFMTTFIISILVIFNLKRKRL